MIYLLHKTIVYIPTVIDETGGDWDSGAAIISPGPIDSEYAKRVLGKDFDKSLSDGTLTEAK